MDTFLTTYMARQMIKIDHCGFDLIVIYDYAEAIYHWPRMNNLKDMLLHRLFTIVIIILVHVMSWSTVLQKCMCGEKKTYTI